MTITWRIILQLKKKKGQFQLIWLLNPTEDVIFSRFDSNEQWIVDIEEVIFFFEPTENDSKLVK